MAARLLLRAFPRYNRFAVRAQPDSRLLLATLLIGLSLWAASCAVPLGPGYTIEKQRFQVRFVAEPEPRIRIEADYQLKNTGNRALRELELRLPGRRRFHYENPSAQWDSTSLAIGESRDNPRNSMLTLSEPWTMSTRHRLRLAVEFSPPREGEPALSFSRDAFFLPASGWSPELLPSSGLFGSGGVPPKTWELLVAVPEGFQIHTSGLQKKSARRNGELSLLAEQGPKDPYPFVIAGRYKTAQIGKGRGRIHLWTREQEESERLREADAAFTRVAEAYNASFGERSRESEQTWIVECPVLTNCFSNLNPMTAKLLGEEENEPATAEMISQDTMVVDISGGMPKLAAAAAPSLASSWLGYGQNPAFHEQGPPLSLLPAFAASIGREAAVGTPSRDETIRTALHLIPVEAKPRQTESASVLRAKSFLFFYALQDYYGREMFRRAIEHVLYARRGRGFELSDLIAAFEQEDPRRNAAEFVRHWMKHPGVPEEFRARYEGTTAARVDTHKETTP